MQRKNKGFTLIELLVVVLIIGILAAVALPQYKKAVVKSRLVAGIAYVKAVKDAEEIYYMENGSYTNDMANLGISIACPKDFTCHLMRKDALRTEAWYQGDYTFTITASFEHRTDLPNTTGKIYCYAASGNSFAKQVCTTMGPLLDNSDGGFRYAITH